MIAASKINALQKGCPRLQGNALPSVASLPTGEKAKRTAKDGYRGIVDLPKCKAIPGHNLQKNLVSLG
jgi:hypothetical protein